MKKEWQADRKVPGLGLMVLESGVRTWYLRYREPGGKQQTHKIGRAGVISLTTAREEARKLLADAARGLASSGQGLGVDAPQPCHFTDAPCWRLRLHPGCNGL